MTENHRPTDDSDGRLEDLVAELTVAAYAVALRHGLGDNWLDLELTLWKTLKETVQKRGQESPPGSEMAFASEWAFGPRGWTPSAP
jgi:hypothetical protein